MDYIIFFVFWSASAYDFPYRFLSFPQYRILSDEVKTFIGCGSTFTTEFDDDKLQRLREALGSDTPGRVISGVGDIGLDLNLMVRDIDHSDPCLAYTSHHFFQNPDRSVQEVAFMTQVMVAVAYQRPISMTLRGPSATMCGMELLKQVSLVYLNGAVYRVLNFFLRTQHVAR